MTDSFAALDTPAARAATPTLPRRTAAAVIGASAGAGLLIQGSRAGLGLALAALAVLAAAGAGTARIGGPWRKAVLAGACLLAISPFLRDTGWLVALDLVAALGFAALAMAPGRSWVRMGHASSTLVRGAAVGPAVAARSAAPPGGRPGAVIGSAVRGTVLAVA